MLILKKPACLSIYIYIQTPVSYIYIAFMKHLSTLSANPYISIIYILKECVYIYIYIYPFIIPIYLYIYMYIYSYIHP